MANPNPSPKTRFVKGQSGNPSGGKKLPLAIREARKMSLQQFIESTLKLLHLPGSELTALIRNPYTPVFEMIIARAIINAVARGDMSGVHHLLDRCFGKAPIKIEHEPADGRRQLEQITDEDLAQIEMILSKTVEHEEQSNGDTSIQT
jgi:hypothetical protein